MRQVEHKHMWKEGSADHDYMPSLGLEQREQRKARCVVLIPQSNQVTLHHSWLAIYLKQGILVSLWRSGCYGIGNSMRNCVAFFPGWWATASLSSDSVCALVDLELESLCCSHSFSHLPFRASSKDPGVQGSILRGCERTSGVWCAEEFYCDSLSQEPGKQFSLEM